MKNHYDYTADENIYELAVEICNGLKKITGERIKAT